MFRKRLTIWALTVSLILTNIAPFTYASETEAQVTEITTEISEETRTPKEDKKAETEKSMDVVREPVTEAVIREPETEAVTREPETEGLVSEQETDTLIRETEIHQEATLQQDKKTKEKNVKERSEDLEATADIVRSDEQDPETVKDCSPVDASTTLKDGYYTPDDFSFAGGTGKLQITCQEIKVTDGKAYAILEFSSNSVYEVQWAGGVRTAESNIKTIEIPVALNETNTISLKTVAMSSPRYILYTVTPLLKEPAEEAEKESDTNTETETETETEIETETETAETETETAETETETETQTEAPTKGKYFDKNGDLMPGSYTLHKVSLAPGYQMFNVTDCKITSEDGKVMATLTLNGTGYDYLFLGTKEEAVAAPLSEAYPYKLDKNGKYTYTVPVPAFDQVIIYAARSKRYAQEGAAQPWYDKGLIFDSSSLQKDGEEYQPPETEKETEKDPGKDPSKDPSKESEKETNKPEDAYPENTSGVTSAFDNSTNLSDGVYQADSFGYTGGTGRLFISCGGITVKGGKAFVSLTFSSGKIIYVKAGGNKYGPSSQTADTSTFLIPVKLNGNTQIIACTTAMSKPHEVSYTISVGLKAAKDADKDSKETESIAESAKNAGIDEEHFEREKEAPEILGLTYTGSYKAEEEKYFRLHYYKDGFKVLEICISDTEEPDWKGESKQEGIGSESDAGMNPEEEAEEDSSVNPFISLYNKKILQYLLVPEDGELPAGIEKEMILIPVQEPVIYCAAEDAAKTILKLDPNVTLFGEEDMTAYDSDDLFLQLLINQITLAVIPDDILDTEGKVVSLGEDFQLLDIPMILDRSCDEKTEKAAKEWQYVYAALLNAEEKTE